MTLNKPQSLAKALKLSATQSKTAVANRHFTALYYEEMYRKYLEDPNSVGQAWREYFENKDSGAASQSLDGTNIDALADKIAQRIGGASTGSGSSQSASEVARVLNLYRSYQTVGHEKANTDPLKLMEAYGNVMQIGKRKKLNKERLEYRFHGFSDDHLNHKYYVDSNYHRGFLSVKKDWVLKDLIQNLEKAYCGSIGVEYMHIQNVEECNWIREQIEEKVDERPSDKELLHCYDRLCWAVTFGDFLQSKYNTQKRFGLEGCDSFIPGLKQTIDRLVDLGVETVTIGMPHRGRLNVLANVLRKPLDIIFQEFQGEPKYLNEEFHKSGDVKYHLGTSYKRTYDDTGKSVEIHLLPNPSHLELVNPVVCGFVRATQHYSHDQAREKNAGIVVHGDAAFAGQGICYETMQMADLYNYTTGGTIHFVVNNQIGFTTTPIEARSGLYCTDLAKTIGAPVFHVNADDVVAVDKCCRMAAEYRQKFKKDVIVDIIGYRKYGHNELDQPSFTQPLMYEQVRKMRNVLDIFEEKLIADGILTKEKAKTEFRDKIWEHMTEKYNIAREKEAKKEDWVPSEWDTIKVPKNMREFRNTGLPLKKLVSIGTKITTIPEDFDAHRMIRKIYDARLESITTGKAIDWGTAEALAMATLIDEDFRVRISGQDVERGTFSHRHAVVHSQSRDEEYVPLGKFNEGRTRKFIATNSHLSENAVLGFEYGYSIVNPNTLTIWEAQFGDFYNGAQAMIDQFVSSGEAKWDVASGLVILLPHGYDGAGPEHSSGRVERFLEMCDDDPDHIPEWKENYFNDTLKRHNWQVVNSSTSANYFHLLRRQMHREYRKPLIVMAPKKLLKHKGASSDIHEFEKGLKFKRTIDERNTELVKDPKKVKKIIFCTGQVYYDLAKERDAKNLSDTAIITVEQLFPVPYDHLKKHLETYSNADDIVWCQEEPKNYGAYSFMRPRIINLMKKLGMDKKKSLRYAGRAPNSSPATGFSKVHASQQAELLAEALK
jgi:2-oxoglutarate dehydrogenase E1 component